MKLPPSSLFTLSEEYQRLLREVLSDLLAEQLTPLYAALQNLKAPTTSEYLRTAEALEMLRISKPTLHKLREKGLIDCIQSSDNRVLYRKSQIEAYLKTQQRKGGSRA